MEESGLAKVKRKNQQEDPSIYTHSQVASFTHSHQRPRKSKKDALLQKKRRKDFSKKTTATDLLEADNAQTKHKSDQDHLGSSQDIIKKTSSPTSVMGSGNSLPTLLALLNKPSYLSLRDKDKNRIIGNYGHGTAYFKRPLIQGTYFLEFTVKQDSSRQRKMKYGSALRFGICQANFNADFPLGYKQSVGYKSIDGSIIYKSEKIGTAEPYKVGDTIGVCLKLGSLQKDRDAARISEGSCLSFYKNGRLVFEFKGLRQVFYCFAASFYNFSQAEVIMNHHCSYLPKGRHYFKCLKEKIPYKDLEHNGLFKI